MRSIIPSDKMSCNGKLPHLNFLNERSMEVLKTGAADATLNESMAAGRGSGKYEFSFDRVFGPNATQDQVFDEISQLVQSAIDGYNVCIFAYGQTGSGKTYTMEGNGQLRSIKSRERLDAAINFQCDSPGGEGGPESEGMIPRSVRLIFSSCEALKSKGWTYKIEASFLEIYNETIRDLLCNSSANHEIRMQNNEVVVTNLKVICVFQRVFSY